jgi:hypothetical protein
MKLTFKSVATPLILGAALLAATGCTDATTATRALENQGLTPVEVGGYAWLSCGKDDAFRTKFTATNVKGQTVTGAVCSGWFKGATIRFD